MPQFQHATIPAEAIQHAPDANTLQTAWQHQHRSVFERLALEHACAQNAIHEAAIAAQFKNHQEHQLAQAVQAARTLLEHEQVLNDRRLGRSGGAILQTLIALGWLAKNHSGHDRPDGYVFADHATVASLAGVSLRSVERILSPNAPAHDLIRRFVWSKKLMVEHPEGGMSPAGKLFRVRTAYQTPGDNTQQPGACQRAYAATWWDWQMTGGGSLAISRTNILQPIPSTENTAPDDNRQKMTEIKTLPVKENRRLRLALEGVDVQIPSENALKPDNRQMSNRYRSGAWWTREQGIQALAATIMERLSDHRDSAPFWRGMAAKIVIEREKLGIEGRQGPLENAVWGAVGIACDAQRNNTIKTRNVAAFAVGILKRSGVLESNENPQMPLIEHPDPALETVVIQA